MAVNLLEILLAVVVLTLLYIVYHYRKPKGFPPGPMSLPIIGNLHQLGPKSFETCIKLREQYGDVFSLDFGSFRAIVLNSHKVIREGLAKPEFGGRPYLKPFLSRMGGKPQGIGFTEGSVWAAQRRFNVKQLRDFGLRKQSMETFIRDEVEEILQVLDKLDGKPIYAKGIFHLAAVNGLWGIIAGDRFDHSDPKLLQLVKLFTDDFAESGGVGLYFFVPWLATIAPKLTGYTGFTTAIKETAVLIQEKIDEARKTYEKGQPRHFLDMYLEAVLEETDPSSSFFGTEGEANMLAAIGDLLLGAIETTSSTLSWSIMLLAAHENVQEQMHKELESIVGTSRLPTVEDERNLPYSCAVINEIIRFSTVLPLSAFRNTTTDTSIRGYKIPKNTMVVPNLYYANRDPEIWKDFDPNQFIPERFIKEDGTLWKTENVFTFSTGKRVCPGELFARTVLFLFISSIFLKVKVGFNPEKPKPAVDCTFAFTLAPKSYEYVFKPRY